MHVFQFRAVWDIKNVAVDGEQVSPVSVVAAIPYPTEFKGEKTSKPWTKKNSVLVILGTPCSERWTTHYLTSCTAELLSSQDLPRKDPLLGSVTPYRANRSSTHQSKSYTATLLASVTQLTQSTLTNDQTLCFEGATWASLHIILEGKALGEMICSWLFLLHLARTKGTSKLQAVTVFAYPVLWLGTNPGRNSLQSTLFFQSAGTGDAGVHSLSAVHTSVACCQHCELL